MKAALLFTLALIVAPPAFAQRPADTQPPQLPDGAREAIGTRQPIEQELPPDIARRDLTREGLRIVFARRFADDPQPAATLGQIDTGAFAVLVPKPEGQLAGCHKALNDALGHLAEEGKKMGANALVRVGSHDDAGYLPVNPSFLCERTRVAGEAGPAVVMRVRLVGSAVKLP